MTPEFQINEHTTTVSCSIQLIFSILHYAHIFWRSAVFLYQWWQTFVRSHAQWRIQGGGKSGHGPPSKLAMEFGPLGAETVMIELW